MTTLPAKFVLYIPTRKHLSSLVLLNCTKASTDATYTLTYSALDPTEGAYHVKFDKQTPESSPYGTYKLQSAYTSGIGGAVYAKRIFHMKDIHVISPSNMEIPVLRFTDPTKCVQGGGSLVRNFSIGKFEVAPPVPIVSNSIALDISGSTYTNYLDISGSVVAHIPSTPPATNTTPTVPPPVKRKKLVAPIKPVGDINLHVARKLMELAILKKEMCPITVEEFSAGNTAVMPCGHLFMQMAIEESFKKEHNKCPECRQIGSPTYV